MSVPVQRRLLAEFLRARRARLTPAAAGLPAGAPRRRTPGLRREEVALLAGLSTTWYTWLEQGRDVAASPQALARLADALALGRAERAYLFELAGRRDPALPAAAEDHVAPAALVAAVSAYPGPAYVLDRGWTAVAWNGAAAHLFIGWLDGAEKNLLRFIFLEPAARGLVEGFEERARRVVAELRADLGHGPEDPRLRALIDGLAAESADFARWWGEQAVLGRDGGRRAFRHPEDGPLAYEQLTLISDAAPGFRLVLLVGPVAAGG